MVSDNKPEGVQVLPPDSKHDVPDKLIPRKRRAGSYVEPRRQQSAKESRGNRFAFTEVSGTAAVCQAPSHRVPPTIFPPFPHPSLTDRGITSCFDGHSAQGSSDACESSDFAEDGATVCVEPPQFMLPSENRCLNSTRTKPQCHHHYHQRPHHHTPHIPIHHSPQININHNIHSADHDACEVSNISDSPSFAIVAGCNLNSETTVAGARSVSGPFHSVPRTCPENQHPQSKSNFMIAENHRSAQCVRDSKVSARQAMMNLVPVSQQRPQHDALRNPDSEKCSRRMVFDHTRADTAATNVTFPGNASPTGDSSSEYSVCEEDGSVYKYIQSTMHCHDEIRNHTHDALTHTVPTPPVKRDVSIPSAHVRPLHPHSPSSRPHPGHRPTAPSSVRPSAPPSHPHPHAHTSTIPHPPPDTDTGDTSDCHEDGPVYTYVRQQFSAACQTDPFPPIPPISYDPTASSTQPRLVFVNVKPSLMVQGYMIYPWGQLSPFEVVCPLALDDSPECQDLKRASGMTNFESQSADAVSMSMSL